ncbi:MAG: hypothetical protein GY777_13825 [Candidatus Brocadiaceae bacterium]|nr:hypothetical protein [Candidatus Brocadiaceae bacterium]
MTNREKLEANESKAELIQALNNTCQVCFNQLPSSELQLAHRVAANKFNIKEYGRSVMYHPRMLVLTCSSCNSSVLINRAAHPKEAMQLINSIKADIVSNK